MHVDPTLDLACELIRRQSVTPLDDGCQQLMMARLTALGWSPKISLEEGIRSMIRWFEDNRPID